MTMILRPAVLGDAAYVGMHLREDDRMEVSTLAEAFGYTVGGAVIQSFVQSEECHTIWTNTHDKPIGMLGVADDTQLPGCGIVWLLATPEIKRVWFALYKRAPAIADGWGVKYPGCLHNVVDARNTLHLRWLDRCGFARMGEADINGHKFIHVVRTTITTQQTSGAQ